MLNLFAYFQTWNPSLILFSLAMFIVLEVIGFRISRALNFPDFLRPIFWLSGLGLIVLIWFLLHFSINFNSQVISISTITIFVLCLPYYIKLEGRNSLFECVKSHPWPIVVALPLLPAVFVKTSLPPYYFDEMAYQYLSPLGLHSIATWDFFSGGLYQNLPRLLNTAYYLIFAVTKTYVPARLLHFMFLFTSFYSISLWLRKNVGLLTSIFFVTLYFYIPIDLIVPATLGYVDIASVSLIALAAVTLIDFIINKKENSLLASAFIWGMASGIKYTAIIPLTSYSLVAVLTLVSTHFPLKKLTPLLLPAIILFIFGGGYWELKNLILFYNPIFPFVFPCKHGLAESCQTGSSFFSGWTRPITLSEMPAIFKELLAYSRGVTILFVANLVLIPFQRNKKILKVTLFVFAAIVIEFTIMKHLSGFYMRYFQHVQVLLMLITALQLSSWSSTNIAKRSRPIFFIFFIMAVFFNFRSATRQLNQIYSVRYIPRYEAEYALGKANLEDWIKLKFPRMNQFIFFCNQQNTTFDYVNVDPDIIWFEYDGMMRVFMTNCQIVPNPLDGVKVENVISYAKENKLSFSFPSINPCVETKDIRSLGYENSQQIYLRQLTNEIVCHSEEILPNVYKFDWRKLK